MSNDCLEPLTTVISHLKGARTFSVWEDLTVCDFSDIIDCWGKNGVQATNLFDLIICILWCLKLVQNSYFRSRLAIFRFFGALTHNICFHREIRKISAFFG